MAENLKFSIIEQRVANESYSGSDKITHPTKRSEINFSRT